MNSATRHLSLVPTPPSTPAEPPSKPTKATWLEGLCREFEQRLPTLFPPIELGGLTAQVARCLGPTREVVVAPLPDEDKVHLDGPRLTVAPDYPLGLESIRARNERLDLFALYVAHEVAHIPQGISDKGRVEEMHAADGEDTLLWLDHEADHAAARYCEAVLQRDFLTLRRRQLQALRAFPVGHGHRPPDRRRKARRVVDLATDIAARERDLVAPDEIVQLLWTTGGGPALVVAHGSFRRVLLRTKVSSRYAGALAGAANPDPRGRKSKQLVRIAGQLIDRGEDR